MTGPASHRHDCARAPCPCSSAARPRRRASPPARRRRLRAGRGVLRERLPSRSQHGGRRRARAGSLRQRHRAQRGSPGRRGGRGGNRGQRRGNRGAGRGSPPGRPVGHLHREPAPAHPERAGHGRPRDAARRVGRRLRVRRARERGPGRPARHAHGQHPVQGPGRRLPAHPQCPGRPGHQAVGDPAGAGRHRHGRRREQPRGLRRGGDRPAPQAAYPGWVGRRPAHRPGADQPGGSQLGGAPVAAAGAGPGDHVRDDLADRRPHRAAPRPGIVTRRPQGSCPASPRAGTLCARPSPGSSPWPVRCCHSSSRSACPRWA
jgi:hypothetical protein